MRYHWLAQHMVLERFPLLDRETQNQIVSEAVCRAWCSFLTLNYQLMQSCVTAAAERKGLTPAPELHRNHPALPALAGTARRAVVFHLDDYR